MKNPFIIRYGIIHIQTTFNKKRYRFSTHLKYNKPNAAYVSENYKQIIQEHEEAKSYKSNQKDKRQLSYYINLLYNQSSLLKKTTLLKYQSLSNELNNFFKDMSISDIHRDKIEEFYQHLLTKGQKKNTIKSKIAFLKAALNLALENGQITKNPIFIKKGLENCQERFKQPFNLEEVKSILCICQNEVVKNYLKIAFFSGLRQGEILALQCNNINLDKDIINITHTLNTTGLTEPKTKSSKRAIDILPIAREAIISQMQLMSDDFLFCNPLHYLQFKRQLDKEWIKILNALDLPLRPIYNTRHSFASIMLNHNENILWVSQRMLGHKNANITLNTYTQFIENNNIKRAAFLESLRI